MLNECVVIQLVAVIDAIIMHETNIGFNIGFLIHSLFFLLLIKTEVSEALRFIQYYLVKIEEFLNMRSKLFALR